MAHLIYALHQGEGFVEITGEVGTGKTTLCRSFLENLDENTEAAYIFNPNLDSIELLKAINDEFGIDSTADNAYDLVDILNRFLMTAKASGKSILLVIDEAQNLSREVLEQIRLLSNLETTQNKLLQIVLVGQPELQKILDSYELRQLRQRVTLSLSLEPLSPAETTEYVKHRLEIASGEKKTKFSKGAIRFIYKYSKGTPRLINIACDRSLLTAYGLNQRKISVKIARQAIKELRGKPRPNQIVPDRQWKLAFSLFAVLLIGVAATFTAVALNDHQLKATPERQTLAGSTDKAKASKTQIQVSANNLPAVEIQETDPQKAPKLENEILLLGDLISDRQFPLSRIDAFRTTMDIWDLEMKMADTTVELNNDYQFFLLATRQSGLMLYRIEKDLDLLLKLNLPAIMKFRKPTEENERFLVLNKIKDGDFVFTCYNGKENKNVRAARDDIETYWTGDAFIPWKNFFAIDGEIPHGPPNESLITLKLLLRDMGYNDIELAPTYDSATRMAVMDIQKKHDLPVDGVVGSMTKIALYNEKRIVGIPMLNAAHLR